MSDPARLLANGTPERAVSCFETSRTTAPLLVLDVAEIVDLLHVSHAPERIAEYREAMQSGARFPPVSVLRLFGRFYLADGHKRFSAYRELGGERIPVEVWGVGRWFADQARQFVRKTGAQVSVIARSPFDAAARSRARRMFWDTIGHWRRIASSLTTLRRRRR